MSKLFSKTVKKTVLWSVIIAIVLAAAIVVCALFGFNQNIAMKDRKALTVSLDSYTYNTQLDDIKGDLVGELGAEYVLEGTMSGLTSEVVFVFEMDADLEALKTKAESYLATKLATSGANYNVSTSTEEATVALAKGFVLRAAIAGVVLAVLAFVYVSLRYNLASGIVTGVSALLGMLLAASVIVLARVYVTSSVAYAITLGGLLATAMTLFTLNNVRAAEKEGAEETVADCVAVKEVLYTAVVVAVGMIAVGVLGKSNGIWFAVSALVSVAAAAFVALFFAPACYLSLKTAFNNKPAKGGYVGAKKTSTKEKKAPAVKVVEEAPVEEAPAEEVVEEAPVEEAPAEEVVEEAPVEEAPAEEVVEEAPVEEVPAEETTEE